MIVLPNKVAINSRYTCQFMIIVAENSEGRLLQLTKMFRLEGIGFLRFGRATCPKLRLSAVDVQFNTPGR